MLFEPGQIVGEYQIVRPLGRGGLGAVYEAVHRISQRADALKVLLPEQTGTVEMTERFRREIQMLATLNHPHISGLHNAFHVGEQLIMVMELVRGEDLRTISRSRSIAVSLLLGYARQTLDALQYAHLQGIVHRDIKPANIMVSPAGLVKVLDFGIAIAERSVELTAAGALIGSPTHISPEQIRGEKATPQSDIYSFGVTLYELIAGQPPVQGATTFDLMMAHINTLPAPLASVRPDISPALSAAIARALEKNPADRFASAADFATALEAGEPQNLSRTATISPASWQRISTDELKRPSTGTAGLPLDPVIRHLAGFIGPIAKIVVNRIAGKCADLDQLYLEASCQIDDETQRQRFLRTRPR